MKWRMDSKCADCPFHRSGPGYKLRRSLQRGRWREILLALKQGRTFHCHKTTHETGDGSDLICAGALEWQARKGLSSNLVRIMQRLDAMGKS